MQFVLAQTADLAQRVQREPASDDRGGLQRVVPLGAQPPGAVVHAGGDGGRHVARHALDHPPAIAGAGERARVDAAAQQLLHDERVAVGALGEPGQHTRWEPRHLDAQAGGGQLGHLVIRQRRQFQQSRNPVAGARLRQGQRGRGGGADRGQQYHRQVGQVVHQVLDDAHRLGVAVLQIAQADQRAATTADHAEQAQNRFCEHHRRVVALVGERVPPLGDQAAQRGPVGESSGSSGTAPERTMENSASVRGR